MLPLMAGAMALALTAATPVAIGSGGPSAPDRTYVAQYGGGGSGYGGGMAPAPAPRAAPSAPAVPATPRVLTDSRGRTLYIFDRDGRGVSNCYGRCARTWPPFLAPTRARANGVYTVVKRRDGRNQWAFQGHPLYRYAGDRRAGQVNGNGIGGVWHVLPLRG